MINHNLDDHSITPSLDPSCNDAYFYMKAWYVGPNILETKLGNHM